jgi:hypothetical protein
MNNITDSLENKINDITKQTSVSMSKFNDKWKELNN